MAKKPKHDPLIAIVIKHIRAADRDTWANFAWRVNGFLACDNYVVSFEDDHEQYLIGPGARYVMPVSIVVAWLREHELYAWARVRFPLRCGNLTEQLVAHYAVRRSSRRKGARRG